MGLPICGDRINCFDEQLMAKAKTPGRRPQMGAGPQTVPAAQTIAVDAPAPKKKKNKKNKAKARPSKSNRVRALGEPPLLGA